MVLFGNIKMKNKLTIEERLRALKFMLLGKEFKFEINYSDRYLNKVKQIRKKR